MRPLIEIQTIPIEIQMKTTNAHLEYARGTAQMEVSRDRRGLQIRSQPIRVNIDTFEARSSIVPTTARITSLDDSSFFINSFRISEKSLNNRCVSPFFHLFQFAADIQEQPVQDQCCHHGEDRLRQDNVDEIIAEM